MRAISESAAVALLQKLAAFRITLISRKGIELCSFMKTQLPSCSWGNHLLHHALGQEPCDGVLLKIPAGVILTGLLQLAAFCFRTIKS